MSWICFAITFWKEARRLGFTPYKNWFAKRILERTICHSGVLLVVLPPLYAPFGRSFTTKKDIVRCPFCVGLLTMERFEPPAPKVYGITSQDVYNRNLIHHSRANGPPSPKGKARHTFGVRKKRSLLLTPTKKGWSDQPFFHTISLFLPFYHHDHHNDHSPDDHGNAENADPDSVHSRHGW